MKLSGTFISYRDGARYHFVDHVSEAGTYTRCGLYYRWESGQRGFEGEVEVADVCKTCQCRVGLRPFTQ